MHSLANRHILLGISGGIAAYKCPELVRRLIDRGAQVRVAMTKAATAFITPLTLQAVSGQPVHTDLFDVHAEAAMGHIELARWADAILIAPATANFLAKLAYGHANDLLSTLCLATTAPITVAPAMNQQMWKAEATQTNCDILRRRGIPLYGPGIGSQACGETGAGRMLEPLEIIACLEQLWIPQSLQGQEVLITAGPTREYLDPVRFISNRSSGRMGYAVAEAAQAAGAKVTLVSGPVALTPPLGVQTIVVQTAQDMFNAVMAYVHVAHIFIATAAVADYRPVEQTDHKIKKHVEHLQLELERTPDILSHVAHLPNPPFTVGFAAETQNVIEYARDKLQRKKLSMVAANQVSMTGIGFDTEDNALWVLWNNGEVELPRCSKRELASQLIEVIAKVKNQ